MILKTKIFLNKIDNIIIIATYFCYLLLPKNQNKENILLKFFYSNLKTYTWLKFIENFWNKKTKILICTNIVRISVNISIII